MGSEGGDTANKSGMHRGESAATLALRKSPVGEGKGGSGNMGLVSYTRPEQDDMKEAMEQVDRYGLAGCCGSSG